MDLELLVMLAGPLVVGAAAWGGARQALNGTRESVKEIKGDLKTHMLDSQTKHIHVCERLTAVETKMEGAHSNEILNHRISKN